MVLGFENGGLRRTTDRGDAIPPWSVWQPLTREGARPRAPCRCSLTWRRISPLGYPSCAASKTTDRGDAIPPCVLARSSASAEHPLLFASLRSLSAIASGRAQFS